MIRKIIHIDQEKCNGCGACANACHEGAIQMVDGKAALIRDDYCDGLGDCLPACPTGAITFEEREAAAYDHEAVQKHLAAQSKVSQESQLSHQTKAPQESQLSQWPVQIKLAPLTAPYFDQASGFHPRAGHPYRLSQAGRRGLHGEADPDPAPELYQKPYHRAHGSPLLRRS